MNPRALTAGGGTGSPDTPGVSIAATFTFNNGTPITINSGNLSDLRQGIVHFAITEPVVLGSVSDFIGWLHSKFGFPDLNSEVDQLRDEVKNNPLLKSLFSAFESFYNGIITITVLSVDRTKTSYSIQFAITLDFNPPIDFFEFIKFDSIGIAVSKASASSN